MNTIDQIIKEAISVVNEIDSNKEKDEKKKKKKKKDKEKEGCSDDCERIMMMPSVIPLGAFESLSKIRRLINEASDLLELKNKMNQIDKEVFLNVRQKKEKTC